MLLTRVGAAVEAAQQEVEGQAAPAPARGDPASAAGQQALAPDLAVLVTRAADAAHAAGELLQAQMATTDGKRRRKELVLRAEEALALRGCANLACANCSGASKAGYKGWRCGGCHQVRYCCEACRLGAASAPVPAAAEAGGAGADSSRATGWPGARRTRRRQRDGRPSLSAEGCSTPLSKRSIAVEVVSMCGNSCLPVHRSWLRVDC